MRKLIASSFLCICALFLVQATAHAQQIDIAYGGGTLEAPAATSTAASLRGGYYNTISGDVIFWHNLGLGAEVSWRAKRNFYLGNPSDEFRPVLFDFDAVYAPKLPLPHFIQPQLLAGIGAASIRLYCAACVGYYSTYLSSRHLLTRFGAGVKLYAFGNFFVRPEFDVFLMPGITQSGTVLNPSQLSLVRSPAFSALHATEASISIGFTLGGSH